MPAPINLGTTVQLSTNSTRTSCKVTSLSLEKSFSFDLDQIQASAETWENYTLGVVNEFRTNGYNLSGFEVIISSSLPIGAGLSSSAALICSLAWSINSLFNLNITRKEIALLCQRAEHNFVGIKSGIMDQFTSMLGRQGHVMLLDCQSLEHNFIPLDLEGYELLIVNTNIKHALASTAYNERVNECSAGLKILQQHFPHVNSLRDASLQEIESIQSRFSPNVFNRCVHVVTENLRVTQTRDALLSGDYHQVGQAMTTSHESLKTKYQVSCTELDFLVDFALNIGGPDVVLGSRMMGGGFGGCTINLVRSGTSSGWVQKMSTAYESMYGIMPSILTVATSDGCRVID